MKEKQNNQPSQSQNNQGSKKGKPFFGKKKHRHEEPMQRIQFPEFTCCICQLPIQEVSTVLAYGPNQDPAHFDCVLKTLQGMETLASGESITYLGSGTFGVIKNIEGQALPFQILRKIQIESKDQIPQWKKDLRALVKK